MSSNYFPIFLTTEVLLTCTLNIWCEHLKTAGTLQRELRMPLEGKRCKTKRQLLQLPRSLPILSDMLFYDERGPSDNVGGAKRCFPYMSGIHVWFETFQFTFFVNQHHIPVLQVDGLNEPTHKLLSFLQRGLWFFKYGL